MYKSIVQLVGFFMFLPQSYMRQPCLPINALICIQIKSSYQKDETKSIFVRPEWHDDQ